MKGLLSNHETLKTFCAVQSLVNLNKCPCFNVHNFKIKYELHVFTVYLKFIFGFSIPIPHESYLPVNVI